MSSSEPAAKSPSMSSSPASSVYSDSSSLIYGHETFELFQPRILELCRELWPNVPQDQIEVERMQGGSFNRIISLSIVEGNDTEKKEASATERFILRIPRFKDARIDSDMSILHLASEYVKIKVPQTVFFDLSSDNALGDPYTIQRRIPGNRLHETYQSLSHHQKCMLAQELGLVFKQFLSCRNDSAGTLVPTTEGSLYPLVGVKFPGVKASLRPFGRDGPWRLGPPESWDLSEDDGKPRPGEPQYPRDPKDLDWLETLLIAFEYRKSCALSREEPDYVKEAQMKDFIEAALAMKTLFSRFDNHYCLCHLDFAPRNILINETACEAPIVTGILDFDNAVFGPAFLACSPPTWLWAWDDTGTSTNPGTEDERVVNDPLPTEEQQQLRKIFDETAGTYYCQLAYTPEFRLARKLCEYAMKRIYQTWVDREANAVLQEINEMRDKGGSLLTPLSPPTAAHCVDCRQRHSLTGESRCFECDLEDFKKTKSEEPNESP
ncbi:MAG: hypothetical protein Q9227_008059 [Pyrenula ochraceoflavens]